MSRAEPSVEVLADNHIVSRSGLAELGTKSGYFKVSRAFFTLSRP